MHVKTGDTVMVRSGKYAKAVGKVIGVSPKEGKVIVEDVHMVHKHVKPPESRARPAASSRPRAPSTPCSSTARNARRARVAHKVTANGEKKIATCALRRNFV